MTGINTVEHRGERTCEYGHELEFPAIQEIDPALIGSILVCPVVTGIDPIAGELSCGGRVLWTRGNLGYGVGFKLPTLRRENRRPMSFKPLGRVSKQVDEPTV